MTAQTVIAYKFQAPNGSYWYIRADDRRTIEYWQDKRKLIPLTDDQARITALGTVIEPAARCAECGGAKVPPSPLMTGACDCAWEDEKLRYAARKAWMFVSSEAFNNDVVALELRSEFCSIFAP